jgi:eukaryotic-like serine/threonine-protein kinase
MSVRDLFREGDWLGDYEIRSRLRAGGMATLFLAQRHGAAGVSRPVVIKVIHPHLAENELMVQMFIDEARISSHIRHSNVVYVEEFGEHDGVYYMAMEYVDGCSLQQLLHACRAERRKLRAAVAVHIAIEVAAGLHAAHETLGSDGAPLGIVHRDVSPSNVLVTRDGRVKVIDFGIAKAHGRLSATRSGSGLKGKLRYMSPDQAWGRPIDRRADIYALGVCLWELLTSRALFRASNDLAVLELVRNPTVPPPSTLNPEVSPALDAIVLRAIARHPGHRHQTALELRRDLMAAVPDAVATPPELLAELVEHICNADRASVDAGQTMFDEVTDAPSPMTGSTFVTPPAIKPPARRRRHLAFGGLIAAAAIAVAVFWTSRSDEAARAVPPPAPRVLDGRAAAPQNAIVPPAAAASPSTTATPTASAGSPPAATPTTASRPPPAAAPTTARRPPPADAPMAAAELSSAATPTLVAGPPAAAAPTATTAPAAKAPPRRAPSPRGRASSVNTFEADGAVLADEANPPAKPPAKTKPKPKPKPASAVRADDAVLAQ